MRDMTTALDDVDRALIHALHLDGRAPFTKIGDVLGVSTQTVARRYRRLRAEASLRVVGLPDPQRAGQAEWMVRLTATPNTARDVALALARRADTAWVKLVSGGTEICVNVHTPAASDHSLLLRDVPRSASITAVSAHQLLHRYFGGPTAWLGRADALDPAQIAALTPVVSGEGKPLTGDDDALLAALQRDGRASLAELAAATGGPRRPSRAGWPTCRRAARCSSTWRSTPPRSARRPTHCSGCRSPPRTSTPWPGSWPGTRSWRSSRRRPGRPTWSRTRSARTRRGCTTT